MTGYQAKQIPVMTWTNNTYISVSEISACEMVIADGNRVGLSKNQCVVYGSKLMSDVADYVNGLPASSSDRLGCIPGGAALFHTQDCPGWTSFPVSSNFTHNEQTYALGNYTLSLSPISISDYGFSKTGFTYKVRPPSRQAPNFVYDGAVFSVSDLHDQGVCQPQDTYQWGFSFLLLFTFLMTIVVLSIVLYHFRCFAGLETDADDSSEFFGPFKTALTVAARMSGDLEDEHSALTEKQIEQKIASQRKCVDSLLAEIYAEQEKASENTRQVKHTAEGVCNPTPEDLGRLLGHQTNLDQYLAGNSRIRRPARPRNAWNESGLGAPAPTFSTEVLRSLRDHTRRWLEGDAQRS
ncbi:hypothetical protein LTR95_007054 [Oleoguttula sp. CCFEE 5521]